MRQGLFWSAVLLLILAMIASFVSTPPLSWISGFIYILYDTLLISFTAWTLHFRKSQVQDSQPEAQSPTLTVVVCYFNEGPDILNCWNHLKNQSKQPEQIIFLDDGSTDQASEILSKQGHSPNCQIVRKQRGGKAQSLNSILPEIKTDYFVTLDADTLLESNAVQNLKKALQDHPDWHLGGGLLIPTCRPGPSSFWMQTFQRFEYIRAFLNRWAWTDWNCLLLVSGAFAFYRTNLVQKVGGFSEDSQVEDYELTHRLYHSAKQMGIAQLRVAVVSSANATTDCPNTISHFLRQRRRWFAGFLQTHYQYRAMIGDASYGRLGTLMLPIKSLDTLQPLFGLTALFYLIRQLLLNHSLPEPVVWALGLKLLIDMIYHFDGLFLYLKWSKQSPGWSIWFQSIVITLLEPFFFQPLRHFGALYGWMSLGQKDPFLPHDKSLTSS